MNQNNIIVGYKLPFVNRKKETIGHLCLSKNKPGLLKNYVRANIRSLCPEVDTKTASNIVSLIIIMISELSSVAVIFIATLSKFPKGLQYFPFDIKSAN